MAIVILIAIVITILLTLHRPVARLPSTEIFGIATDHTHALACRRTIGHAFHKAAAHEWIINGRVFCSRHDRQAAVSGTFSTLLPNDRND